MPGKKSPKKDHIYVTGAGSPSTGKNGSNSSLARNKYSDDSALLALQLACPRRQAHGDSELFEGLGEIYNLIALTIETKNFSSLVLMGTDHPFTEIGDVAQALGTQLHGIIKLSLEKVYFIDCFQLSDPNQLDWKFFVDMSEYCFMQESPQGHVFYGYFRLEKTSDEERFAARSMESMQGGDVAEQDVYLYFPRGDRYIKILKKGEALAQDRLDRLQSKGVTDLYVTADQGEEIQQRRIRQILNALLDEYSSNSSNVA